MHAPFIFFIHKSQRYCSRKKGKDILTKIITSKCFVYIYLRFFFETKKEKNNINYNLSLTKSR